jgi:hypothetical protein
VLATPLLWALQVAPPFVVPTMVPLSPTAMQVLVLGQATERRRLAVPLVCLLQVAPPLVVARMPPPEPTA